ncbi:hypothetical protein ABZW11_30910 [Nonomuraea sp. NPDC004580]|uniref:hypothetical protein n=1 Tax=Nonomuraea sp. NPDC004580 TaxID=3154552 RepID=UPI00339ED118
MSDPTDPAALRYAAADQPAIGDGSWAGGPVAVEGFYRWIVADLGRMPALTVHEAGFGHYGSGYASFVAVLVTRRDGSARRSQDGWTHVEGLPLALCRLAPLAAIFHPAVHSSGPSGAGSRDFPVLDRVAAAAPEGWGQEFRQVAAVLERHDITLLDPATLGRPLPAGLQVETFLGNPPYTVFDAWFHWTD